MELDEFVVLVGNSLSESHGISVSRAGVGRGTTEIGTPITTSCKNSILGANSVDGSVFHVEGNDTNALLSVLAHEQIHTKVFDKVSRVKGQGTTIKSVKHSMTGSIGSGTASMSLASLSVLKRLSTKGTLVNLSIFRSGKGHSKGFKLNHRLGSLSAHVVNRILITKPITSLDSVVHVPPPIVLAHVSKSGVNSSLCRNGVGSRWEELGDTGRLESGFTKSHGSSQSTTTGTDDNGIVFVVYHSIVTLHFG